MNNFEHAERLAELTAMGAHELALMVIRLEHYVEAYRLGEELQVALRQRGERDEAIAQRDYLVAEYERAVKCGPQGFAHAAGHLYNAISNAKCDANAERFIAIQNERDAALEREQDKREHVHRLCLDYQSLCEKLEMSWEREAALAAHVEQIRDCIPAATTRPQDVLREIADTLNRAPNTSLARRDLIKQAEALELVNCQSGPQEDTPQEDAFDAGWAAAFELIRQFASELRQRAQELTE